MANDRQCDLFPDIWQPVLEKHDPNHATVVEQNRRHGRIYRAARQILVNDFSASEKIPHEPHEFPGNEGVLTDAQITFMAAVHGILLADDWDPSMGKSVPASDDLQLQIGSETMVIDRRFVDAVVAAVQEYTSRAALFNQCFLFLRDEGQKHNGWSRKPGGHDPKSPPPHSSGA
jgi:hypothetical protein